MKTIKINLGQKIVIDDEDFEKVSQHTWSTWHIYRRGKYEWGCPKATIKNRSITLSRFIMNPPQGLQIDHIDRDRFNNQKSNLRICSNSINGHNRGMLKSNTTGVVGAYYDKYHKKFRAEIRFNDEKMFIGYFETVDEAGLAYLEKKKELLKK